MKPVVFYEDMIPGQTVAGPSIVVDKAEMVAFATVWDPLPFHIHEAAAHAASEGLTAPGIYVLALKQLEWLTKRESKSKADRGIVTVRFSFINQTGRTVMSHLDTILVRRRVGAGNATT